MEVSIIIPVYNTEKFIAKCLDSVLSQTFQDFEIIIVNDCTPDNAMQIVQSYADKDPRIRIVNHETNRGLMVVRRSGYKTAAGKYIMFLDSDDTLPINAIELLHNNVTSTNADIVVGGMRIVDSEDRLIRSWLPKVTGNFSSNEGFELLFKGKMSHNLCASIFRKELFLHDFYTIENQTNGEDLILFYQLLSKAKTMGVIQKQVYNYFQNEGSSTHTAMTDRKLDQFFNIHIFIYNFLTDLQIPKERIVKVIVPSLFKWLYYPYGRKLIKKLPKEIQEAFKFKNIYHHFTFVRATCALLMYKMPFTIPAIVGAQNAVRIFKTH